MWQVLLADAADAGFGMTAHAHPVEEPMRVSDVLGRAADLIEPEGAWTQGSFARNVGGYAVRIESPEAVCFCAVGAIYRAAPHSSMANRIADALAGTVQDDLFSDWNDREGRRQSEVVAKLRKVAEKYREQGK